MKQQETNRNEPRKTNRGDERMKTNEEDNEWRKCVWSKEDGRRKWGR